MMAIVDVQTRDSELQYRINDTEGKNVEQQLMAVVLVQEQDSKVHYGNFDTEDEEGIDEDNSDVRHFSSDSEFEINRPSATLKHPRRSGKPYVMRSRQGLIASIPA